MVRIFYAHANNLKRMPLGRIAETNIMFRYQDETITKLQYLELMGF
jgi:hypothetical protein